MPKPQAPEIELADLPPSELAQTNTLTMEEKVDEIHAAVRQLNDDVKKLAAFLMAPAKKPSAIDQLVAAIEQLTAETMEQGKTLGGIAGTLEMLANAPPDDSDGSTPPPSPPRP